MIFGVGKRYDINMFLFDKQAALKSFLQLNILRENFRSLWCTKIGHFSARMATLTAKDMCLIRSFKLERVLTLGN